MDTTATDSFGHDNGATTPQARHGSARLSPSESASIPGRAHADAAPAAEADAVHGSWLSARIYDFVLALGERAGMAGRRRALVSRTSGAVLEIGAGTGLNLAYYPDELDRLVLCEPEPHMARRLERRAAQLTRRAEVVRATAETLPFEDETFDTVVSTLVLCTVTNPQATLNEIRRVLRPRGSLLFLEHVRSDERRLARWQDRFHRPWRAFAAGCNCNRQTLQRLRDRGYTVTLTDRGQWRRMPPIVRPLIAGQATPHQAGTQA
jgi:SAM-dependent methyltransferase